ncbi:MAG: hypothetical protein WC889_19115, partial [Myxococcota bacterium]
VCPAEILGWKVGQNGYTHKVECVVAQGTPLMVRYTFTQQDGQNPIEGRPVMLEIPAQISSVEYTPALLDAYAADRAMVSYPAAQFTQDVIWIAASNGLVGLGGGRYLVRHCESVNLAFGLVKGTPGAIRIGEMRPPFYTDGTKASFSWIFSVVDGPAAGAYELARTLNTNPVVYR